MQFGSIAPADAQARIDLFDRSGSASRRMNTVFNQAVKAGQNYNAGFRPDAQVSGMYFYRATIGEQVFNWKVSYRK